jgi:tripartite-type tricarboxylate transporter receptor subunit TctC
MATALPHVAAGTLRALAVAGAKRSPALPGVPTVAESGLAGFESSSWQGWFVPAHTPPDIVNVIQQRAKAALATPDVLERLRLTGNEAVGSTPAEFEQRFKADLAKFAKIVKEAHIPLQD